MKKKNDCELKTLSNVSMLKCSSARLERRRWIYVKSTLLWTE